MATYELGFFNEQLGEKSRLIDSNAYNAIVSKTTPGAFRTITDALKAGPTHSNTKYYIHVEAGTYNERVEVPENLTNIVLVGDGAPTTKVQWNRVAHSGPNNYSTDETGTISVNGDGFIAMHLTFENTAGDVGQAAAAVTQASYVAYYKCTFLGFQDTLYAKSGIQFYRECDVYGTVDFICGFAAAVFQSCTLYARSPKEITYTAQNRPSPAPAPPSGFVLQNCTLTIAPGLGRPGFVAYLCRPWSNYSTVVVMVSYLDGVVAPAGWVEWPSPQTTEKVVYREYNNRGPGGATAGRVKWVGYEDVSHHPEKVRQFTIGEFIDKGGWLAGAAGVP